MIMHHDDFAHVGGQESSMMMVVAVVMIMHHDNFAHVGDYP